MKRVLLITTILLFIVSILSIRRCSKVNAERARLEVNQRSLLDGVRFYRNRDSLSVASVERLELSVQELKKHKGDIVKAAQSVGVKPQFIRFASTTSMSANYLVTTNVTSGESTPKSTSEPRDSVSGGDNFLSGIDTDDIFDQSSYDKVFYKSPYIIIDGAIVDDTLKANITTFDTIFQVVHRVPRRFLFFRWGTKAIQQEVISKNPHSHITYTEYIKIAGD